MLPRILSDPKTLHEVVSTKGDQSDERGASHSFSKGNYRSELIQPHGQGPTTVDHAGYVDRSMRDKYGVGLILNVFRRHDVYGYGAYEATCLQCFVAFVVPMLLKGDCPPLRVQGR
jgi:hypothetical protein